MPAFFTCLTILYLPYRSIPFRVEPFRKQLLTHQNYVNKMTNLHKFSIEFWKLRAATPHHNDM